MVSNVDIATMRDDGEPFGIVEDGAVAVVDGRIAWVGPRAELPEALEPVERLHGGGRLLTPGLIDCHTHLVFAGDRSREFELRLAGATYEEIARAGGGILSTVAATREADDDTLFDSASSRLRRMIARGVTTVEIKSGYGLDVDTEMQMLRVARRLADDMHVTVSTTLLGAHALPPEYANDRAGYVELVCEEMIPRAAEAGLADAVDAFCERIAFTPEECQAVFAAGAAAGLPARLHADQLSDTGGAALAALAGARSADHLEYASEDGVAAMGEAGTTAVLLPGAYYYLHETHQPPIDAFREHGVPIAVATDLNPGSSPVVSPRLAMNLGCVLFGLTTEEALAGMTRNAARVLGMEGEIGVVATGAWANLALWDVNRPAELAYWMGGNPCRAVIHRGRVVHERPDAG